MKKWNKKMLTSFVCMMLMMTMVLCTVGCKDNQSENSGTEVVNASQAEVTVLGG